MFPTTATIRAAKRDRVAGVQQQLPTGKVVSDCYNVSLISSDNFFLKKTGSGMHSDTKFGRKGGGVTYIEVRKKRFRNVIPACVHLRNFRRGVPARSVTKIALLIISDILPPVCTSPL
jgi:hypothetical protein